MASTPLKFNSSNASMSSAVLLPPWPTTTGSLPEFDYGSLGRAHELPGPGYTPKHAIFIIAKRMAESTSLKLIETVEIIKLISQKSTILIRKKPKRGFPLYEKSRLPMVYFEPHYSRNISSTDFINVLTLVSMHTNNTPDTLFFTSCRVEHVASGV